MTVRLTYFRIQHCTQGIAESGRGNITGSAEMLLISFIPEPYTLTGIHRETAFSAEMALLDLESIPVKACHCLAENFFAREKSSC